MAFAKRLARLTREDLPLLVAGAVGLVVVLAPGAAAAGPETRTLVLYPVIRAVSTTESGPNGTTLFRESGTLFGVGVQMETAADPGIRFRGRLEAWGGGVGYSGHAPLPGSPTGGAVAKDAATVALDLAGDVGWCFAAKDLAAIPFAGFGVRWWFLDIREATAIDNAGVISSTGPYFEPWSTLYGKLGIRGEYRPSGKTTLYAEGGALYPFGAENSVFGLVAHRPKGRPSGFAEAGVNRGRFRAAVFFEQIRFTDIDPATTAEILGGPLPRFRIDSKSRTTGLRIGVAF